MKKMVTMLSNLSRRIRMAFQILLLFPRILAYCSVRLRDLTDAYQNYRSIDLKNSESMDAEQRYTEEASFDYAEDAFEKMVALRELGYYLSMSIHRNSDKFKTVNGILQEYTVMTGLPPNMDTPFGLKVLSQDDDVPILVDFNRIDMDTYLESIIKNKSITHQRKHEQ